MKNKIRQFCSNLMEKILEKILIWYDNRQEKYYMKHNICRICEKQKQNKNSYYCDDCFNDLMNAGEDSKGNPIF